jgi:hypothetical protein
MKKFIKYAAQFTVVLTLILVILEIIHEVLEIRPLLAQLV